MAVVVGIGQTNQPTESNHAATDTRFCSSSCWPPPYLPTVVTGGGGAPDMVAVAVAVRAETRPAVGQALLLEPLPIGIDDDDVIVASTASLEASYEFPLRRCCTAFAAARLA